MNWIKFKDRLPSSDLGYIYISDGEMIKITPVLLCTSGNSTFEYWLPVFMPDLPKKELHCCKREYYECFESESGALLLKHPNIVDIGDVKIRGSTSISVDFCPFCGYSVGDDDS